MLAGIRQAGDFVELADGTGEGLAAGWRNQAGQPLARFRRWQRRRPNTRTLHGGGNDRARSVAHRLGPRSARRLAGPAEHERQRHADRLHAVLAEQARLGRTDEHRAVRPQQALEHLDHLALGRAVEIDQQVATEHEIVGCLARQ